MCIFKRFNCDVAEYERILSHACLVTSLSGGFFLRGTPPQANPRPIIKCKETRVAPITNQVCQLSACYKQEGTCTAVVALNAHCPLAWETHLKVR